MKDQMISMNDERFEDTFYGWNEAINRSVIQNHFLGNNQFGENIEMHVFEANNPDRIEQVIWSLKKYLRNRRSKVGKTILVGYDSAYLNSMVLTHALTQIQAKKTYKEVVFSKITAKKITQSVDKLLYEQYPIPDLTFIVIQL